MRRGVRGILLAIGLMVSVGSLQAGIVVDFDPEVDFATFKTFKWVEGTAAKDPLVEKEIRAAVERELIVKGFREVRESPDVHVLTHASVETERQVDVTEYAYWDAYNEWGRDATDSEEFHKFEIGAFMVDIVDAQSEKLIWRGVCGGAVAKKPEKRDRQIQIGAEKMFRKFPPKQKSK